jgi:hypothetical protein
MSTKERGAVSQYISDVIGERGEDRDGQDGRITPSSGLFMH